MKNDGASPGSRPAGQAPAGLDASRFDPARAERLALNLRSYAYAMGAPRRDTDEEVALGAERDRRDDRVLVRS